MQPNGRNDSSPFSGLLTAAERAYRTALPLKWDCAANAAIATGDGQIFAASDPSRSTSLAATLRAIRAFFGADWSAGDIALTNDVFTGCSHPTEFTAVCPIYFGSSGQNDGQIRGWFVLRTNLGDVGGWELGGYTLRALDIWAEGVRIVPVKLMSKGRLRREIVEILRLNSRTPHLNSACATALVVAADTALRHDDVGLIDRKGAALFATANDRAITRIRNMPTGRSAATATVAAPSGSDITIRAELEVKGNSLLVSFPGALPRREQPVNATSYMVADAVTRAVSAHMELDQVETIGLASNCVVDIPEDSLLSATHTAPVSHALLTTCVGVERAVRHALAELGIASSTGTPSAQFNRSQSCLIDPSTGALILARQREIMAIDNQLGGPQ